MALFFDFCEKRNLDSADVWRVARSNRPMKGEKEVVEIKQQADWEGIAYPAIWDEDAITRLANSLTAINAHGLAYAVENAIDTTSSFGPVRVIA